MPKKMTYIIKGIKKTDETMPYDILDVSLKGNAKCKNCNDKPRRDGSAYCVECAKNNKGRDNKN